MDSRLSTDGGILLSPARQANDAVGGKTAPSEPRASSRRPAAWLFIAAIAITIACGVFFRLDRLDGKYYYDDEAVSSLREAGYTAIDFASAFDGRPRTAGELSRYLTDRSRLPAATVASLAAEDPQHPPLYYLLAKWWSRTFGESLVGWRMVAALFGSLAIAGAFWLGLELFGSAVTAAILAALVALAPLHVVYAQWNREYSLWLLGIAVTGALLLRALRRPSWVNWLAYGLSTAVSLYVAVLFIFNLVAFAGLTFVSGKRRETWAFVLATLGGCVAYIPWLVVLVRGSHTVTNFQGPALLPVSAKIYALKLLFALAATYFDLEYEHAALIPIACAVLFVVFASFAWLTMRGPRVIAAFVWLVGGVPLAALITFDITHHASHGTMSRYLIPVWFASEVAVAYTLGALLQSRRPARCVAGSAVFAALLLIGFASDACDAPSHETWAAAHVGELGAFARVIDGKPRSVVLYVHDGNAWDLSVLALTTVLRPDTRIALFADLAGVRVVGQRFFLLDASDSTRRHLQLQVGGRWIRIDPPLARSGLVRAYQAETASNRANRRVSISEATGQPLWERLPSESSALRRKRTTYRSGSKPRRSPSRQPLPNQASRRPRPSP